MQYLKDANTLEEAVYQSLGAASVCWQYPEKAGIFQSDIAKEIGDELLAFIEKDKVNG